MMRVLLVAPGPRHSTYDVFQYYLDAMNNNPDIVVQSFNYHNIAQWQKRAILYYKPEMDEITAAEIATSRAARELVTDILLFKPDIVFVISGLAMPVSLFRVINDLRQNLINKFAISFYFTECPYHDDMQLAYMDYVDIAFLNDKRSLRTYDPKDNLEIYYLPHSYNPKVHKPLNEGDDYDKNLYKSDLFFTATPFRERGEFLAKVNWANIDFKLGGNWAEFCKPEDYLKLHPYIFTESIVDNDHMARFYANSKISLNIHRRNKDIEGYEDILDNKTDAYSVGPRVFEAVACGAALLTDFRQEAVDIFKDTISYFETPEELSAQAHYLLEHEDIRLNMINEAQNRIKNCTFNDRLNDIILPVFDRVVQKYLTRRT